MGRAFTSLESGPAPSATVGALSGLRSLAAHRLGNRIISLYIYIKDLDREEEEETRSRTVCGVRFVGFPGRPNGFPPPRTRGRRQANPLAFARNRRDRRASQLRNPPSSTRPTEPIVSRHLKETAPLFLIKTRRNDRFASKNPAAGGLAGSPGGRAAGPAGTRARPSSASSQSTLLTTRLVNPLAGALLQSRYNNGLIAKLILMWRREERREIIAWLLVKHQAEHGCIGISGSKKQML